MATVDVLKAPMVSGILLLESSGARIATKYYDPALSAQADQISFEHHLTEKIASLERHSEPEVLMFRDYIIMYRCYSDFNIYVLVCYCGIYLSQISLPCFSLIWPCFAPVCRIVTAFSSLLTPTLCRSLALIFVDLQPSQGSLDENELLLATVLTTLCDTLTGLLKKTLDVKLLTENFDVVLLVRVCSHNDISRK